MHTTEGPLGTSFHHHGDFSGEVKFSAPSGDENRNVDVETSFEILVRAAVMPGYWASVDARREGGGTACTVEVPVADLRFLAAVKVRGDRIRALEDMDTEELLENYLDSDMANWGIASPL
jgi:hypothetical protein